MEVRTAPASAYSVHPEKSYRIDAIDLLRGMVMIIMALDHTRDSFHAAAFTGDPLDVHTTTPLLFFTRWVTHFCAPVFVFLSGTSVYFQGLRKSKPALSAFIIKRGLWLIVADVLIMTFALSLDIHYSIFILEVIWAIGISMVLLGFALWLPFNLILATGIAIVAGHNALDFYEAGHTGPYAIWYSFLHVPGVYPLWTGHVLGIFYPFLPWTGVMLMGYCFGKVYQQHTEKRNKIAAYTGMALLVIFILLRSGNTYGDSIHWSPQKNALLTFFSFINTQKYPPSLLYLCVTLGPALIVLGLAGNVRNRLTKIIMVYGRVPFLYFVLHFYLLRVIMVLLFLSRGHTWKEGAAGAPSFLFKFIIPGEGYSLGIVYLIWISVVIALYPVCKWFSEYKKQHRNWWLSYL